MSKLGESVILEGASGNLLIIGGREDKTGAMTILRRFVALAGGPSANIITLTTASTVPDVAAATYADVFKRIGVTGYAALNVTSRLQANDPATIAACQAASGILLSGGDQSRLTTILGGTQLEYTLREKYLAGATLAGTSAGAAALGETIILGGPETLELLKEEIALAPGLDLINDILIDQHFEQRMRIYRLLSVLALNPGMLAVGIDENTALLVTPDGVAEVLGSDGVTIVDGRNVSYNNLPSIRRGDPISITGLTLHILTESHKFDLNTRTPIAPNS